MAPRLGLFLPTQPELVIGGGYRYPLSLNSSLSASFYHMQIPAFHNLIDIGRRALYSATQRNFTRGGKASLSLGRQISID